MPLVHVKARARIGTPDIDLSPGQVAIMDLQTARGFGPNLEILGPVAVDREPEIETTPAPEPVRAFDDPPHDRMQRRAPHKRMQREPS
jgi:hypothetical protein